MQRDAVEADKNNVVWEINCYLVFMLSAIVICTFVVFSIAVIWVINLTGLLFLFGHRLRDVGKGWFRFIAFYLLFSVVTLMLNLDRFSGSIKSIGTNVNLIVTPIYIILLSRYSKTKPFSDGVISRIFNFISVLGMVAVAFAWATGYQSILRAVTGSLSVYQAKASGLFYNKNIYGAFVALSSSVDLYQYSQSGKIKSLVFFALKFVAVMVSFSRAALLQAGLFSMIFLWMNKKRSFHEWLLLAGVCLAVAAVMIWNQQILNRLISIFVRYEGGDAGRASERSRAMSAMGNQAWEMIFGVGFSGLESLDLDIDNTFYYTFFTGGIIKCAFFAYLFIRQFFQFRWLKPYNGSLSNYSLALGLSYLAYAYFESVSVFELGLLNYLFTLLIFLIPSGYDAGTEAFEEFG